MRVIDHRRKPVLERKHRRFIPGILICGIVVVGVGLFIFLKPEKTVAPSPDQAANLSASHNITETQKKGTLKQFTGAEFRDLYNTFAYPNTARINESTPITGDEVTDARIKRIAEGRGYQVRVAPVADTFQDVGSGMLLQQRAAQPWLDLVAAAKADGLNFSLTAAYRSADEQKKIFMERLVQAGIPVAGIAVGSRDSEVSQLLRMTAIPGYSRHHTGYTVDIACGNTPDTSFAYTECFEWLSANNYEKAKTHGWIPSYPDGAGDQGPDPEAWEYVWVGKDAVTE